MFRSASIPAQRVALARGKFIAQPMRARAAFRLPACPLHALIIACSTVGAGLGIVAAGLGFGL